MASCTARSVRNNVTHEGTLLCIRIHAIASNSPMARARALCEIPCRDRARRLGGLAERGVTALRLPLRART